MTAITPKTAAAEYWAQQLIGPLPVLQLPTDQPRTANQSYQSATHSFAIPELLSTGLQNLSEQEQTDLFTILLTAFKILVYRYTNTEDIITGTSNGKNILVLRTNLSGNPTFLELLKKVEKTFNESLNYKDYPFENLLQEQNLTATSIFQVACTKSILSPEFPKVDLHLSFSHLNAEIEGIIDYNSELFNSETIDRITGHYQTILEDILANRNEPINSYQILTEAEIIQITQEWNNLSADYPKDKCLHQLIEEQVERTPEAIAVKFNDQSLTYRQLNNQANQLAHYLQKLGIGPEIRVGVCADRSLEIVIAFIAIFKAGGVYVPLDPTYPKDRLAYMIEDSNVPVLLTQTSLISQLPTTNSQLICLDELQDIISPESQENLITTTTPSNAAYLLYTSGTTGKPKAVVAEHKNLMNYILAAQDKFKFESSDVMPCIARFSFSISLLEILGPWMGGGTSVVISRENVLDMNRLVQGFNSLTNVHLTPSLMRKAIDYINAQNLPAENFTNIRRVFMGGDTVAPDLIEDVKPIFKNAQIYILYGCSETTTLCSNYPVSREIKATKNIIGSAFNNVRIRIYDPYQNLVPIGVPGEIYVGGASITRGYANREDLTREKYVVIDGERFYKTGDVGRFLKDGKVELLGRTDFQVSLRGFRIEVAEIESILRQHPQIHDSIVTAREDIPGDKRLVAYIVLEGKTKPKTQELREYLAEKLPDYMIPTVFMVLEALPVTPNGKQDRKSLPAPPLEQERDAENEYIQPRDEVETKLAKIWGNVLNINAIGVKDNFFGIGGNSLQAVTIFSDIQKSFGKSLPLATLLSAPTIEQIANILRNEQENITWSSLVPIQPKGSKPPLFCVHAAAGNVLFYRDLARLLGEDQPVYGLQAQGLDGVKFPLTSVEEMAAYYLEEIRNLQIKGPYHLAGYSFGGAVAFEIARQLQADGETVGLLGLLDSPSPELLRQGDNNLVSGERLSSHWSNLSQLGMKEKFNYVVDKLQWKVKKYKRKLLYKVSKMYRKMGRKLPEMVKNQLLTEAHRQAAAKYNPPAYQGTAILFRASIQPVKYYNKADMGWTEFVGDGLEIHEVPGKHDTLGTDGVMSLPNVEVLARKLKACLEKVNT
ncbi:MAG TPA: amino acid adenylation domain-containing protein [Halomicronema sp.]